MRIWTLSSAPRFLTLPLLTLFFCLSACSPELEPVDETAVQQSADARLEAEKQQQRDKKARQKELRRKTAELMQPPQLEWQQPADSAALPAMERAEPFRFIQTQSRYEQQFDNNDALDLVLINRAKHTAYRNLRVSLIYLGESGNVLRRDTVRVTGDLLVERALRTRVPVTNPPPEWIPFSHDYRTEVVTAKPVK